MEKRKPRSASLAMLRASTAPRASNAAWPSSKIRASFRSRFSLRKSRNWGKKVSSPSEVRETLQKTPTLRSWRRQAAHDLGAAEQQQVVDGGDQTLALGHRQVFGGHHHPAGAVAQAGEALVEDGAALGQGDHRLQVEVDAVLGQGVLDRAQQGALLLIKARFQTAGRMGGRGGQLGLEALADLGDQAFQHADFAGQLLGARQGAGLDGLGQFGEGVLGVLHGVGQQAVGLAHGLDLAADGAAVQRAGHQGVQGHAHAQRPEEGRRRIAQPEARAPDERRDRQGQEQIDCEEQSGCDRAHGMDRRLPGWNRPSIGVSGVRG